MNFNYMFLLIALILKSQNLKYIYISRTGEVTGLDGLFTSVSPIERPSGVVDRQRIGPTDVLVD